MDVRRVSNLPPTEGSIISKTAQQYYRASIVPSTSCSSLLALPECLEERLKTVSKTASRPGGLEYSKLRHLPLNVIYEIALHLPLASAASFAFSCRVLGALLGPRYWHLTRNANQNQQRHELLCMLEKDLPDLVLCFFCECLHTVSESGHDAQTRPPFIPVRRCIRGHESNRSIQLIHYGLHFPNFQMAMKRHRLGLDCAAHLRLLSGPIRGPFCNSYGPEVATTEARIFEEKLLLKVEKQIELRPERDGHYFQIICPHSHLNGFNPDNGVASIQYFGGISYQPCFGLKRCNFCLTEFQVELRKTPPGRFIVTTSWVCFGQCLTPNDQAWTRCALQGPLGKNWLSVEFELGTIKSQFEMGLSSLR